MKIKKLKWIKRDAWVADTPASEFDYITICHEDGLYWASWDLSLPGTKDLDALKQNAQEFHDDYIKQFLED